MNVGGWISRFGCEVIKVCIYKIFSDSSHFEVLNELTIR